MKSKIFRVTLEGVVECEQGDYSLGFVSSAFTELFFRTRCSPSLQKERNTVRGYVTKSKGQQDQKSSARGFSLNHCLA